MLLSHLFLKKKKKNLRLIPNRVTPTHTCSENMVSDAVKLFYFWIYSPHMRFLTQCGDMEVSMTPCLMLLLALTNDFCPFTANDLVSDE